MAELPLAAVKTAGDTKSEPVGILNLRPEAR
jgi:hypothetical protein